MAIYFSSKEVSLTAGTSYYIGFNEDEDMGLSIVKASVSGDFDSVLMDFFSNSGWSDGTGTTLTFKCTTRTAPVKPSIIARKDMTSITEGNRLGNGHKSWGDGVASELVVEDSPEGNLIMLGNNKRSLIKITNTGSTTKTFFFEGYVRKSPLQKNG